MVIKPTYITVFFTVITINTGFIFTNNSTLVNKVEVIPGISDHEVVYVQVLRPDNIKKATLKNILI